MSRPPRYTRAELDQALSLTDVLGSVRAVADHTGIGISTLLARRKERARGSAVGDTGQLAISVQLNAHAAAILIEALDDRVVHLVDAGRHDEADTLADICALFAGRSPTDSYGITAVG